MYVGMNRFKVMKEGAEKFEARWLSRESYLHELKGFMGFQMLRGPEREDHVLYSSYTLWESKDDFTAWTKSDQFRKSHERAEAPQEKLTIGHPEFEGFDVLQSIDVPSKVAA
ncbi:antibiotic biosynthesis monooxygenase [Microvirga sp. W0021]|uniref:Antibiotic biosynthesis monooxygenase n=1 Tax=Hohaiivirga grylli TaxID=3133970 RepID=A0ABV0BJC5_9HYPH